MESRNYGMYAVALVIVAVGALWAGLPVATPALLGLVLVGPLMMIFMMRGMHGGHGGEGHYHDAADRKAPHDHTSTR